MRDNKGFTLIELLIVVVIIGILAAIAIPKFSATREKAFYSALKSDMKNLATQQEIYHSDWYSYSTDEAVLEFVESSGVNVAVGTGDANGWAATGTHDGLGATDGCAMYYGTVATPPTSPAAPTASGEVACTG